MNHYPVRSGGTLMAMPQNLPAEAVDFEGLFQRCLQYLDLSGDKSANTYISAVKRFFGWMADNGITAPTRQDVLDYRDYLKTAVSPKTGKPLRATTRQNYIVMLRVFFSWLSAEGIYPNVADHIKGAKVSRDHKKDTFGEDDINIILDDIDQSTLKGKRDYAILMVLFYCGCRTIELSRADVDDLAKIGRNNVLYVQRKGHTEKDRENFVKLVKQPYTAIRSYLKARGDVDPSAPLFVSLSNNSAGKRLDAASISKIIKKRFKAAGYDSERWTAHSTRHSAITLAVSAGENITDVQSFAGHASVSTTMIYSHNDARLKSTVEQTVADCIGRKK